MKLLLLLVISIVIQIAEGYLFYLNGVLNCGTQLKLSAIASGLIICVFAYRFIFNTFPIAGFSEMLKLIGDNSFGIFFCHIAIMMVLNKIPGYTKYAFYPLNGIIALVVALTFTLTVKKLIKSKAKYLGM